MSTLTAWLRRVKPARVKAGDVEWPAPVGRRPWDTLADICGDADIVQAYTSEGGLLGVWRRPAPVSAPAVADPLASIRSLVETQSALFRDVLSSQSLLVRTMRENMEVMAALRPPQAEAPDSGDDGGELDAALLQALQAQAMRPAAPSAPEPVAANGKRK